MSKGKSNRRWFRGRIGICVIMLAGLLAQVGLNVGTASATNYRSEADSGIAALQSFYSSSNGLFNTTGWWNSANALETIIDYSARTNTTTYTGDIATTYNDNNSGNFENSYYDDTGWWGLTWVKAYDLTGNTNYLNTAKTIFSYMTGAWDSTCNGGIWWNTDRNYKNAIPNELFLTLAARLHNRTPGDSGSGSYLDWAQREWNWFKNSGMINSSSLVNDGLNSSCQNNGGITWTYNQGVILGGLVDLYKATGDSSLISQAEAIANAATSHLVNSNGILQESCETSNNCNGDQAQFKGIFMKNVYYLYLADQNSNYYNFITKNADSIWNNDRNSSNQFGLKWTGSYDSADAARQSSAQDAINAALGVTTPALYEAENASSNVSNESTYGGYTGSGYRCCWNSNGQYVTFTVFAPATANYQLNFHYGAGAGTATRKIQVNGSNVVNNYSFSGTSGWSSWANATQNVSLNAGLNTVTVTYDSSAGSSNYLNLDNLSFSTVNTSFSLSEAENASSNVATESSYGGYTGSGYRCCWNGNGQYVTFTVNASTAGAVQLVFHYGAGAGNATRKIMVNGNTVSSSLNFGNTGSWSSWSYSSISANLVPGSNTITVTFDSSSGNSNYLNLDNLNINY